MLSRITPYVAPYVCGFVDKATLRFAMGDDEFRLSFVFLPILFMSNIGSEIY